uniref:Uncharacterized protein n=1 Tax=Rhizophora mucronata TaxID=61149 RepID=A0A2P2N3E9_RHIMU
MEFEPHITCLNVQGLNVVETGNNVAALLVQYASFLLVEELLYVPKTGH